MRLKKLLALVVVMFAGSIANAQTPQTSQPDEQRPDRGWHFYDLPPEIVNAIKEEIERQVEVKVMQELQAQKPPEPAPGSSEWINQNLPKFRARAADNPNSDNIRALLYLERVLMDRAALLGRRATLIAQSDPYLDTSYKPTANLEHARYSRRDAGRTKDHLVKRLVDDGLAIWTFIEPNCPMCERQAQALANLTRVNAVPVLFILTGGAEPPVYPFNENTGLWEHIVDDGHSELFPLLTLPTSYAFNNATGEYVLVSQGHSTMDMLVQRTINAADFSGWASPQEVESVRFSNDIVNLGLFDFSKADGDLTDPSVFVDYITEQLSGAGDE